MDAAPSNSTKRIAAATILLTANSLSVVGIISLVGLGVKVGMFDEVVGLAAIALFSSIAISVITTVGYERVKMFFSIDRIDARFDRQDKKLDAMLAILVEIRDILRKQYGSPDDKKS